MASTHALVIPLLYFQLTTLVHAQHDLHQIAVPVRPAAYDILQIYLQNNTLLDQIFDHGCWCAKLNPNRGSAFLGGKTVLDDLDVICKEWAKTRKCNTFQGGSCSEKDLLDDYNLIIGQTNNETCLSNPTDCTQDTCEIDVYYAGLVIDFINNLPASFVPEEATLDTCIQGMVEPAEKACIGDAPHLEIVPIDEFTTVIMTTSGIDNLRDEMENATQVCEGCKMDFVILLDSGDDLNSGNLNRRKRQVSAGGYTDFQLAIEFLKHITVAFELGENFTRVALAQTGAVQQTEFTFLHTRTDIWEAIERIEPVGGVSNIGAGLSHVDVELFDKFSEVERPDVSKVLLIITAGDSNDDVTAPGTALKNNGVISFAIGVGTEVVDAEIDAITHGIAYVKREDNFYQLDAIKSDVASDICYQATANVTLDISPCTMLPTQLTCYNSCVTTMQTTGYSFADPDTFYTAAGTIGWANWDTPVCGFDGVQYFDFCEFKCTSQSTQYFYQGECASADVCSQASFSKTCNVGAFSHLTIGNTGLGGFCGSDGTSYLHEDICTAHCNGSVFSHGNDCATTFSAFDTANGDANNRVDQVCAGGASMVQIEWDYYHAGTVYHAGACTPSEEQDLTNGCYFYARNTTEIEYPTVPPTTTEPITTTEPVTTLPADVVRSICSQVPMDVIWIMDGSTSVDTGSGENGPIAPNGDSEWDQQINFIRSVNELLTISPTDSRVAMLQYSFANRIEFQFQDNATALQTAVDAVVPIGGGTMTARAMRDALTNLIVPITGARYGVRVVVIVVTDGSSADNVVLTTESNKYVALGIDVVAVGIDEAVTSQLEAIASDPSFVYQATTFAELGGFGETLTAQMCDQPIGYTTLPTTTEQETTTLEATTTHAPTITNAQQGAVYDVLIEAGVNNLAKQLAVTLTWENDCDLNLHVWEPSGEEISDLDYNYGASATGGELFDKSPTENLGLEVTGNFYLENISWDTAPFGDYTIAVSSGCDTDEDPVYGSYGYDTIAENDTGGWPTKSISYSLFVWIDGETTVFNRTTMPTLSTYDVVSLTFDSTSEHLINEILPSKRHFYNGADSYEDYYSNYGPYGK